MSSLLKSESPIILGLWPIAGVTTVGVTPHESRDTIRTAIDAGITLFDTAFSYGYDGESDRLIGEFLRTDRDRLRLIGKVGQRWTSDRKRVVDATPQTIVRDTEQSLRRIGISSFDLLMLHAPDPQVPLEISAAAIAKLRQRGDCRAVGICNADARQRRAFAEIAGCDAIQCPLNLMQRESLIETIPDAERGGSAVHVYWTLMKGLLAGKITPDHRFAPGDSRPGYAVYQGQPRQRAHAVIEQLQRLGQECGQSVAQLAIGWTLAQPGVTAALVGAHRPEQIRETAAARQIDPDLARRIDNIVARVEQST